MEISFIIVNYKSDQYLERCLFSLKKNLNAINYEVILVNNDPNLSLRESFFKTTFKQTTIVNCQRNDGFAMACNVGAKKAQGKYLFFLNPDTELTTDISKLLSFFVDEAVGIVAPTLILPNGALQPWNSGDKISLWSIIKNKLPFLQKKRSGKKLSWVSGAAILISRKCFDAIKGFDEKFFMYFEDVDLCLRAEARNFKIILAKDIRIIHFGGGSQNNLSKQKRAYYLSQDYYFQKHCGSLETFLLKLFRAIASDWKFSVFLFFCTFLPFQFALNPLAGVDLAIVRIIIPLLFLLLLFSPHKKTERFFIFDKHTKLIFLFLILAVVSLFSTHNLFWSLRKFAFLISIFPVYFIARFLLNTSTKISKTLFALSLGGVFVGILAILQFCSQFIFGITSVYDFIAKNLAPFFLGHSFANAVLTYPSWLVNAGSRTYMRATAIFPDPHMLSYYLGLLLPWSLAFYATSKGRHASWFLFFSAILFVADILTFTRGGYLALISATLIIFPLISRAAIKKFLILAIFLGLLFFITPQNPVGSRLSSSFDAKEGSNQGRIYNWRQALPIIKNHPLGVGIGMYSLAVNPSADYREPIYAHNLYLDIAAELGIPTLLVFLVILLSAFLSFWKIAKKNIFGVAGVACITIFSVHSLVETPLYSVHVLSILLIFLAISVNISHEKTSHN